MRILGILIILLSLSFGTYACSCIGTGTVKSSWKYKDYIIAGVVEQIDTISIGPKEFDVSRNVLRIHLTVQFVYKGIPVLKKVYIHTNVQSSACGIRFTLGEKYLIYGNYDRFRVAHDYGINLLTDKALWVNKCSMTKAFDIKEHHALMKLKNN